jgi:hypothetical protein
LILLATILTACQGDRTVVDSLSTVTFRGAVYYGVSGERFDLDRDSMLLLGTAEQDSLPNSDGSIWGIPDVDPASVVAAFDGPNLVLLVEAGLLRGLPTDGPAAGDPLAASVPALCPYWRDPLPIECRGLD